MSGTSMLERARGKPVCLSNPGPTKTSTGLPMSVETFTDLPAFQRKVTELTSSESLWCASLASMLCENIICNKWEGHFRGYSVAVASGNAILEDPAS